jgi:hypothetical protein
MYRRYPSLSALCAILIFAAAASGQPGAPLGGELQVNGYTTSTQFAPTVAAGADGDFVVTWMSDGSAGSDDFGYSIQARRYNAAGLPLGDQFQVNDFTTSDQMWPSVATLDGGGFVVVWSSRGSAGSDTAGTSVQARRFGADGSPAGAAFQVNGYTTGAQDYPRVAAGPGGFVVVWSSYGSAGDDTAGYSIQSRRFATDGTPLGGELQVNGYTPSSQDRPAVATAADGSFLVVWMSSGSAGDDSDSTSIQARHYAADGTPSTGDVQVNSYTPGGQLLPSVAAAGDDFVVAWTSGGSAGSDSSGYSVQARRVSSSGAPLDADLQVNLYTPDLQFAPSVAAGRSGGFVVAWESLGSFGGDLYGRSIQGRIFDAGGAPLGSQFEVNGTLLGDQFLPAVAADVDTDFVVVWNSFGSAGDDADSTSVQAQRFASPASIFTDGFESGGTSAWSATVP